jgi:hypothetical protein
VIEAVEGGEKGRKKEGEGRREKCGLLHQARE